MVNKNPLVTVILPCYNAERFVRYSIDSILNQSYTNMEILCIDDCSTDSTLEILKGYERLDSRVKVYSNLVNMKLAVALNVGLKNARGTYVARMDADDISTKDRIELQVRFMENNPAIDICGGQCIVINELGTYTGKMKYFQSDGDLKAVLLFDSCFAHPSVLFKKEVYDRIGGYRDMMPIEDLEYWTRMAIFNVKMANLPNVILHYRVHENNVTALNNKKNNYKIEKIMQLYELYPQLYYSSKECMLFNMRFLLGNWNAKTSLKELEMIETVSNNLYKNMLHLGLSNNVSLKKIIKYYKTRAYISCLKSRNNISIIRIKSFFKLLSHLKSTITTLNWLYM